MPSPDLYEKTSFSDRLREIGILSVFIAGAALCSALLMDLIVYPTALFAIKNKAHYTVIIKYMALTALVLWAASSVAWRVLKLRRDGFGLREIAVRAARRSLRTAGWLLVSLGIAGTLLAAIYFLLSYNYYLLYKLTQI